MNRGRPKSATWADSWSQEQKPWTQNAFAGFNEYDSGSYGAYASAQSPEFKMYEKRMNELLTIQKRNQMMQGKSSDNYSTIPSLMDLDLGFQGRHAGAGFGGNSVQRGMGRGRSLLSQAAKPGSSFGRGITKPSLLGKGNQQQRAVGFGARSQNYNGYGYDNSWDYNGGYNGYNDYGYGYNSYDDYYCDYSGYGYNRYQGRGYGRGYGNQGGRGSGRGKSADGKRKGRGSPRSGFRPGRIEFPDLPMRKMQQGEILLALQSVKQDVKNKAKKGNISWKDLDKILHEYKLHGSTLFYRDPEKLTFTCELYTGNFLMGIGECETKDGNRLEARIKAYDDAIEKLKNKTPGECLDFSIYLGLRQIKEREVDQVISPGICKVSNVGNIMTMRTDLTPKSLTDMVLLQPAKPDHQSVPEMLKGSGVFSKFFLEYYFFKNRKGDSRNSVSCNLYVEKKLISKCTGPNNFTAKNKASDECLDKLKRKCYTIETRRFPLSIVEQNVDSSLADLILNKAKYLKNPREISKRLQLQLLGNQKDEDGIQHLIVVTRADVFPHEVKSEEPETPVVEEKKEEKKEAKKEKRKKRTKSAAKFDAKKNAEKSEGEASQNAEEQNEKSAGEQEDTPEKEPPAQLDAIALKRVELILVKYIESDMIDNMVFSNEFVSSELAQIKEVCIEYKLRPEMLRLSGSDSINVLFVRKVLEARQVVERLLSTGGETARYKVIPPPELPKPGDGDSMAIKDDEDDEP